MKFLKLVMFRPLTRYWFSATLLPPKEGKKQKAQSPSTEPGASKVMLVRYLQTGTFV